MYEGEAVFTPHTGRKHHNRLRMFTTEKLSKIELSEELQAVDRTAFNIMKLPHAKVTAGRKS